jgi:hypothetical protein
MMRRMVLLALALASPLVAAQGVVNLGDLRTADLCRAVTSAEVEALLAKSAVTEGKRFSYDGTAASSGCQWDGGKSGREAVFAYAAIVPAASMRREPAVSRRPVSGLGREAFLNNGADARQLWVLINDQQALLVARGDRPDDARLEAFARALLPRLRK